MSGTIFPDLGGEDSPHDATIMPCPAGSTNWIDLEYLYEDGAGVPGAAYVVQRPHGGEPGGTVLAAGVLDSQGKAHVPLPLRIEQVEVYFHNDPNGTPYEDPEAARATQEPDPGFFHRLWNGLCDAADWVGGVIAGDFKEDPSTSQLLANTLLTMIPGLDQFGDARDVIAHLKKLLWDRRWDEAAVWLGVLLCLIGLFPVLGSLAKGMVRVALREASQLADLLAVFNFFKKGNGVRWLREFAQKLPTDHATAAVNKLTELLDRAREYLQEARHGWFTPHYLRQSIDRLLENIREVKTRAPQKLREAAAEVATKIT